ncbi:MAG: hypothetical protein WB949_15730, partial [Candidatus Acidiferrales bacterium]
MTNTPALGYLELRKRFARASFVLLAAAALLALPARLLVAQGTTPRVTAVDPPSGKANDMVTVTGESLEKSHVSAVFLSDDKDDHKVSV